jgi:hypothetical protein
MEFTRVISPVADMEIWSGSSNGFSFVISYESRSGPGFRGQPGYVASWRSLSSEYGRHPGWRLALRNARSGRRSLRGHAGTPDESRSGMTERARRGYIRRGEHRAGRVETPSAFQGRRRALHSPGWRLRQAARSDADGHVLITRIPPGFDTRNNPIAL